MEIKKGQEIYIWVDRYGVTKTTVKSVGRKYITVELWNIKFDKETLKEVDYRGLPSFIIPDLDKYNKDNEIGIIKQKLSRYDWCRLDNDTIEKVYEIMKNLI